MVDENKEKTETMKEEKVEEVPKADELAKKSDEKDENKEMKTDKKKKVTEVKPKEKAIVNGASLRISTKYSVAICKMISRKSPDRAIELLEGVAKGKMPVRMASSEVAHQKSRGMKNIAGAKFPKKAALVIIELIKQLKANSIINGIENPVITIARADKAARPFRSGGRKAKRTHVHIEVREFKPTKKTKMKTKKQSKNKVKMEEKK
tara:strand:+ start:9100 stop:9720 length:621 start_codon:yes stop_codon:yes gene_type:complete